MKIAIPENLKPLARAFTDAGVSAYAVGGLVRNTLLGLPVSDTDICSRLTPAETAALCERSGLRWFDQGARYGTVAIMTPAGKAEHTTFRADRYGADGTHRPDEVRFSDSLTEDAFRRDFTVNALYASLDDGTVIDPTGGADDLARGVLRATSKDPDEIMRSDALRVLRLVRFAGELGFAIEPGTMRAAAANAGKLKDISAERISAELNKILVCDARYDRGDVLRALMQLDELRAFDVFWPELAAGRGLTQRSDVHRYEVLEHGLHVCAGMPPEPVLRTAGLLHDVGKPESLAQTGRYRSHDRIGVPIARGMLQRLRYRTADTERICALIGRHMYDIQDAARESTLRRTFTRWGRTGTADMIAMREADVRGCGIDTAYVQRRWRALFLTMQHDGTPFSIAELAIDGADVLRAGVPAGPQVGRTLERLRAYAAASPRENTRERLLKLLVNIPRQN